MDFTLDLLLGEPLEIEGLPASETHELAQRRNAALASTDRIELDSSAMQMLGERLLGEYGEFAPDAVDAFYALRDELPADIPDVEVIETLAAAMRCAGGDAESLDIAELARQMRIKDDSMLRYSITDDTGHVYRWDPGSWEYDEQAPGWDGERWEDDYDE